ncbi:MAG: alpha/beta fold hydrolase [Ilumatobacteraceae bacterium]|jgi:3-oxoadipate enol-lactonase|nr:alpha/beta hydrolase [Actinomycetota bacterium]NCW90787.1 alpha/beta hydrolase [Acidimicrobiia bacterium]NCV47158.1 alpha/beta hydrolase [Actinomycetota bacterium]NCX17671.1 alpha/beta hydrolase [Acidimicrobiia bacterium]NCX59661.1 alpha/beta hydrolase [Actinomycetota bacterium]
MIRRTHAATRDFPQGHEVDLPGRGRTFVREVAGPVGAPTVILLHGWTATADLNWFTCFDALGRHFRVLAPDHRGHGRGLRPNGGFRLSDCADDVAAIADVFGVNTFIPVGYSMGGAIAQLLAQRHEMRVRGLVLAATAGYFASSRDERLNFLGLNGLARLSRLLSAQTRSWVTEQIYLQRKTQSLADWAARQIASHDWRHVLEAGSEIGAFDSRRWLNDIDVPAAMIITTKDQVVPTRRQEELAASLRSSTVTYRVEAGHDAVFAARDQFVPLLVDACQQVVRGVAAA